jgi:cytochrome c2
MTGDLARSGLVAALAMGALALAACQGKPKPAYAHFGGDPVRGAALVDQQACGACHVIPGKAQGDGLVGPPLTGFANRTMIAGTLPNTPANLTRWIQAPQAVRPGDAMPDMGLTAQQSRDIAAYLYTLR